jgi:hypothetical protein
MIEMRSKDGNEYPSTVDQGTVTVTSTRVVFNGAKKREWAFEKLEGIQHVGTDRTMMFVGNRKTWSGVTYDDPERTRLLLQLAVADATGTRQSVIDAVGRSLRDHGAHRPTPPEPPGPAPASPVPNDDGQGRPALLSRR